MLKYKLINILTTMKLTCSIRARKALITLKTPVII